MPTKRKRSNPSEPKVSDQIGHFLLESERIADQAKRAKKSLTGNNASAERFHNCRAQAFRAFKEMKIILDPFATPSLERTLADMEKQLTILLGPKVPMADRREIRREIEFLVKTEIEPSLSSVNQTELEFIPIEIVDRSRGYVVNTARQINNCFHGECFDACGVMIRKLLETLIIEVFEKKGIASIIKDGSSNYLMLTDLVSKLLNTPETPVGRTTRKELPMIAVVLNNCAHNRAFNISKTQLIQNKTTIVIAVQELMGLWDVRNP